MGTFFWLTRYIFLKFAHICCCSSSHCGVPALKLTHELSLQASSDPTSDIGIVSFSFLIYYVICTLFLQGFYSMLSFIVYCLLSYIMFYCILPYSMLSAYCIQYIQYVTCILFLQGFYSMLSFTVYHLLLYIMFYCILPYSNYQSTVYSIKYTVYTKCNLYTIFTGVLQYVIFYSTLSYSEVGSLFREIRTN